MVGFTAISVHYRFWKEHKVNEEVFKSMKREQAIGILEIVFIIVGFALQLPAKI